MACPSKRVSVSDARTRLGRVIEDAENGVDVVMTRRGLPIVRLAAVATPRKPRAPIDFARIVQPIS
ncbi:MAG: type II toxin-antitoxin system Phd/YefM family antitoxin [Alphaproteobacteria bacterium]|nr:type II toxin-antitoxin system Phd/YefM family antitoxin [Alphaproteobacteria bacterium]